MRDEFLDVFLSNIPRWLKTIRDYIESSASDNLWLWVVFFDYQSLEEAQSHATSYEERDTWSINVRSYWTTVNCRRNKIINIDPKISKVKMVMGRPRRLRNRNYITVGGETSSSDNHESEDEALSGVSLCIDIGRVLRAKGCKWRTVPLLSSERFTADNVDEKILRLARSSRREVTRIDEKNFFTLILRGHEVFIDRLKSIPCR